MYTSGTTRDHKSLIRTIDLPVIDLINHVVRIHSVHGAPHGLGGPQDLLHHSGELLGHGPGPHDPGRVDDVVQADVTAVLDVLHLLPVPGRLLQRLDDEGGGGGDHGDCGLPVLDLELHGDLEALPLGRVLGDVVTNLLGRQTEGADLGGEGGGGANFTADSSEVDVFHLGGVELWSHGEGLGESWKT